MLKIKDFIFSSKWYLWQGAQLRTHILTNWLLRPAFSRKKNFENPSKIDIVRGKNVQCAPIFQQLPPALFSTFSIYDVRARLGYI